METVPALLSSLCHRAATHLCESKGVSPTVIPAREIVRATSDATMGDYQSNLAFMLAKPLRTAPRNAASWLVERLPSHPSVASVEVAGPGFINFRLDDGWLALRLQGQMSSPSLGVASTGESNTVVVDYGSPNVAKRMHVGHLRSTVIGSALVNLHRAAGYHVVGDNHIGDWGTQFGKLLVAFRRWGDAAALRTDPIAELERLYVRFGAEAREQPELENDARRETARLQAGDPDNRALWREFVDASMSDFNRMYARMGVQFDEVLGESAYQQELGPLVQELLDRGIALVDDGAVYWGAGLFPEEGMFLFRLQEAAISWIGHSHFIPPVVEPGRHDSHLDSLLQRHPEHSCHSTQA